MTVGQILGWLVMGLIVGLLARLLVPGRQAMSIPMTIILGIIGAVVGGILYNLIAHGTALPPGGFNVETAWQGWIFAILGGVIVLWAYAAVARRS
jgi:uncharacterized membrane protein YeaQ/YmgE (transglycosylase-associated protein family)